MKSEPKIHKLQELANAYSRRELRINPEYQRGTKWSLSQKQALIDSLLRGYQIPLFYVHLVERTNSFTHAIETTVWLVDGQQRLAAIADYLRNEFSLPDAQKEAPGTVLPSLLNDQPSWHGKKYEELAQVDRERLVSRELQVIEMREEASNEVRDLFIRLQAGTPLTAQEKRDAWPGNFTLFVIRNAGKPSHPESNPKDFFKLVRRGKTKNISVDDGDHYVDGLADTRKFFAGLAMTIMVRERSDEDFVDLKGKTINDFYQEKDNLDLRDDDEGVLRVLRALDVIVALPGFADLLARKAMAFQPAFHLALLVDSLNTGEYVPIWRDDVIKAFIAFQDDVVKARQQYRVTGEPLPHYEKFVALLGGSGSDTSEIIRRRHSFFLEKVYPTIRIKPKDGKRLFDTLDKEYIWGRDGRKCKACARSLAFSEAIIHHIVEHVAGGYTVVNNGVLVCSDCHGDRQKMQSMTTEFQEYMRQKSLRM